MLIGSDASMMYEVTLVARLEIKIGVRVSTG